MSQSTEPGPTGWVKFEEPGSGSPNRISSPNRRSPTSSGVSSARGSVNSLAVAENNFLMSRPELTTFLVPVKI